MDGSQHSSPMNDSRAPTDSERNIPCPSLAKGDGTKQQTYSEAWVEWNYSKRQKIDDKWIAECNCCGIHFQGETKNDTKHLHASLVKCQCDDEGDDIKGSSFTPPVDFVEEVDPEAFTFNPSFLRMRLAEMIILDGYPLSIVEHFGFRKLVNSLNPLFSVVSRKEIKKDILRIYHREKCKRMKLLEHNPSRIAISISMWTCPNPGRGFMAVIAHYVDESWILQSQLLSFICVPLTETPEELSKNLVGCLKDWDIGRKLSTFTIDDGFANDSMIDVVLEKLPSKSLWLKEKLWHMPCCASFLNSIVKDGFEVIGDGIERVRDSVAFWIETSEREKVFKETAIQLKVLLTEKLIVDCESRWSSTYLMLQVALGYRDVFSCLKELELQYDCMPLEEDWERVKEVCERLKLFYNITMLFSGSKKPTANLYFPLICEIKIALREWLDCGCNTMRSIVSNMNTQFDKYWSEVNAILAVATILDPRYKLQFLEYCFPKIYGDAALGEIDKVRQLSYDLANGYGSRSDGFGSLFVTSSQSQHGRANYQSDYMHGYDMFVASKKKISSVKSELDYYLEEPVIPTSMDFDVLFWWKNEGIRYPRLRLVAKDILAIPISTIASESAFSTTGKFVGPPRSELHPNMLEAVTCAQDWLSSQVIDPCSSSTGDSGCYSFLEESDSGGGEGDESE